MALVSIGGLEPKRVTLRLRRCHEESPASADPLPLHPSPYVQFRDRSVRLVATAVVETPAAT